MEPTSTEGVVEWHKLEGSVVEGGEFCRGVEGEGLELPFGVGCGVDSLVQDDGSLGEEDVGGLFAGAVGEGLGEYSAFEDFLEESFGIAFEAYG